MALFEVSRVWDAWPRMTGSQALRGLFRQVPTHSSKEQVCGVFMTCSHMFVATQTHEPGGDCLYVFSMSGVGSGGDGQVPITPGGGWIVSVVSIRDEGEVCLVREKGFLEQFSQQELGWKRIATAQLSSLCIFSCTLHPATHSIVYCVGDPGQSGSHTHQVLVRSYQFEEKTKDGTFQLGEPTTLLLSCPAMSLWAYESGIAMMTSSSSSSLLLLWLPHQSPPLQPFLINSQSPAAYSTPFSNHYPSLCLQLAPLWCRVKEEEPCLVSVTVAMTTGQLLLLLSSGEVMVVHSQQTRPQTKPVVQLKDFGLRYHLPGPQLQLFSIHTHYGIFCKGELRVYDGFCGEMVWENDEHEGHEVQLLAPPSSCSCIGIHDNSGVWVLRSRRLSEHAQLVSQALFPITTNADETTPGDYLENGRVLAAAISSLWGLRLPATRHALEALHGIVKQDREEEDDREKHLFLPLLSTELEAILRNTELQSPALLVSLLAEHPRHRQLLAGAVAQFLSYVDCHGDSVTPMIKEVVSQLRLYHSLSESYSRELTLWRSGVARQLLLPPQAMATYLLHKLDGCHDNTRLGVRAQLHLLSCSSSRATLDGIRDYLALPSFEHAVEQLHTGVWSSDRDWKALLGTDSGCGVNRGIMQSLPPNMPLFELICRLLYREQPDELEHFVTFAQLARDFQAQGISSFARRCRKTYFYQRALQCLPQFVSPEATPTSREALLTHAHLILHSGRSGCEGSALRLLLKARLWEDALLLVEQETARTSATYPALYHTLLATMAQEGALHCYMDRAWQLVPKTFSAFDFLSVLGELPPLHPTPLLVPNNTSLTVADIGFRLQELLQY